MCVCVCVCVCACVRVCVRVCVCVDAAVAVVSVRAKGFGLRFGAHRKGGRYDRSALRRALGVRAEGARRQGNGANERTDGCITSATKWKPTNRTDDELKLCDYKPTFYPSTRSVCSCSRRACNTGTIMISTYMLGVRLIHAHCAHDPRPDVC